MANFFFRTLVAFTFMFPALAGAVSLDRSFQCLYSQLRVSYSAEWIDVSTLFNYGFNYELGKVVQKKFPHFFAAPADGWDGNQELRIPKSNCVQSPSRVDCDLSKTPIEVALINMPAFGTSPDRRRPSLPPEAVKFWVTGFHLGPEVETGGISATVDLIYPPIENLSLPGYPFVSLWNCANF